MRLKNKKNKSAFIFIQKLTFFTTPKRLINNSLENQKLPFMCCQTHEQLLKTQNKLLYEYLRLTPKNRSAYFLKKIHTVRRKQKTSAESYKNTSGKQQYTNCWQIPIQTDFIADAIRICCLSNCLSIAIGKLAYICRYNCR